MNHTKTAIFITIYRILVKGKKHYITPSVNSIIELIGQRHSSDIQRRWAFQCLHDLIDLGYIRRQPRFQKNPDGGYTQIPSLISITLKGARKLYDLGVEGAAKLSKEILGWIHAGDKRWPQYKGDPGKEIYERSEGGLVKLKELIAGLPA